MSPGQNLRYNDIAYSHDAELLAAASQDGFARVWNTKSGQLVYTSPKQKSSIKRILFSPNRELLAFYTNQESGLGSGTDSHDNLVRLVPTGSMLGRG